MLDPYARRLIDPPLAAVARVVAGWKVKADWVTWIGFLLGVGAAFMIAVGMPFAGLIALILNRFCDGLDGAIARVNGKTDLGGFLDIVLDFIVYSAIVLGFALYDPTANALYAAILLFAFMGTASSFLAFAIFAARHGLETQARGVKSLYYLGGLAEGTETVLFFIAFCLWPHAFAYLSLAFALICVVTTISRVLIGIKTLKGLS